MRTANGAGFQARAPATGTLLKASKKRHAALLAVAALESSETLAKRTLLAGELISEHRDVRQDFRFGLNLGIVQFQSFGFVKAAHVRDQWMDFR